MKTVRQMLREMGLSETEIDKFQTEYLRLEDGEISPEEFAHKVVDFLVKEWPQKGL